MLPALTQVLPAELWAYALVFGRVGAMVAAMPIFGETMAPQRVRLMIALALTLVMTPLSGAPMGPPPPPMALASMLAGEVIIGLMVGLAARFVMSAAHVAGNVIAMQLGLSFAMAADPAQGGGHGAIIGNFLGMLAITLILVSNLHYLLIGAILHSYTLFPVGGAVDVGDAAQWAVKLAAGSFATGLQMAAPFLVFGLVLQVTAGIISRMMPQVQIFFLTVPVSILAGYVILMFSLSAMMMLFLKAFEDTIAPMAGR